MTQDIRDVLKLALEALERFEGNKKLWPEAITAIKETLAQEQEPVAWLSTDSIGERHLCFDKPLDNDPVQPLYTAPPQRSESSGKPSAWVGLTDEEVRDLWSWSATSEAEKTANTQQHAFARAIQAKLKELNT